MAARGTVLRLSEQKGYGYISPDDEGEELFVHYTEVEGSGFKESRGRRAGELRGDKQRRERPACEDARGSEGSPSGPIGFLEATLV